MKALLAGERHAQRFAQQSERGIALRFGAFYARTDRATALLIDLVRKRRLPLIGPADYYVPSLHIEDAARAITAALRAPSGTYNVCDDNPRTWKDFICGIAAAAGAPPPMHLPSFFGSLAIGYPWKWISRSVRMSNARFKEQASWSPRYPDALAAIRGFLQ
jgi:nucleoside-diphosphate-sugar epimerase